MNPRATGILLLFAAALGAFVWFYEIEGEADRQAGEEAEKRVFGGFEAEGIDWIELTATNGTSIRAERSVTGWDIIAPLSFPGDGGAWDAMAAALATVTSETVFEQPQPADVYGLGAGADEIRFEVAGAGHALLVGGTAPMGGNAYASVVGEDRVHTIASWRAAALRKDFDALRDKSVLDFEVGTVAKFEAEWPGARVVLERDGNDWRLTAPIEGPADTPAVNALLSDLAFMQADGFDDTPATDAELGLDPPAYRATLTRADYADPEEAGAQTPPLLQIAVGSAVDDGQLHVRGGPDSHYLVAAARLDDLPRDVSAYRYKQLADFEIADVESVELTFHDPDGAPVEIVATRDGEGAWQSQPEALDPEKLASLVSELSGLTAAAILAERVGPEELAGLELVPPRASFTVRGANEEPLAQIRIGAQQGGDGILAQAGENPQVFRLGLERSEFLPISLEALRNHFVASDAVESFAPGDPTEGLNLDIDPAMLDALLEGEGGATAP